MSTKKLSLVILLGMLSLFLGASLGKLDFFGFLDGRHTLHLTLLIFSIIFAYSITLVVFLLDFSDKQNLNITYVVSSILFGGSILIINSNIISSVFTTVVYFIFLNYINSETSKRSKLFVKFIPQELFFPVMKNAFLFLVVLFAIINFFQTRALISETNLLTPTMVRHISRPLVLFLNKQFANQLEQQLGDKFQTAIGTRERKRIVTFVLQEFVESMTEGKTRQVFGFRPDNIPVEKVIVYDNGEIDITPVIEDILPELTNVLNQKLSEYIIIAPFAVAFLTVVIFQVFMWPVQLVESIISIVLFKILISSRFLTLYKETVEAERIKL